MSAQKYFSLVKYFQSYNFFHIRKKHLFLRTFISVLFTDIILEVHYGSSRSKHRRTRTAFSHHQLQVLEDTFSKTHYPDVVMREQLSGYTNLPEARIQVNEIVMRKDIKEILKKGRNFVVIEKKTSFRVYFYQINSEKNSVYNLVLLSIVISIC